MKDPKTTVLGILTILVSVFGAAIQYLQHQPVSTGAAIAGISTGIGLIKAADSK
jgi:uncharacterized membrane protein (DUF373 family)